MKDLINLWKKAILVQVMLAVFMLGGSVMFVMEESDSLENKYFSLKDQCQGEVQVVETSDQEIGFECVGYIASSTSSARLKN